MLDFQHAFNVEGDVLNLMIEFRCDQGRGVGIEHLVDRRHHADAHQFLDHFAGLNAHFARRSPTVTTSEILITRLLALGTVISVLRLLYQADARFF